MEIRHPANPEDFESYSTERTRREFLVQDLFMPDELSLTYSHIDRIIIGGACPIQPLTLSGGKALGTNFFLERREMGVINVGTKGTVAVDGEAYELDKTDGLYIGLGSQEVLFSSEDGDQPAHFYILSGPAHKAFPTTKVTMAEVETATLGTQEESNVRVLNKYIHPDGVESCNLVMGITVIEQNSVWNTMPCHTHDRRMEVYFYFDLKEDAFLFHFMGEAERTRHIVVRNEEAVISPSWSIHAGVATSNYSFVWGMVGDNQTFSDMDVIDLDRLR